MREEDRLQFDDDGFERLRHVREEVAPRDDPETRNELEPEVQGRLCEVLMVLPLPPDDLCGSFLIYGAFVFLVTPDLTLRVDLR